MSLQFIVDVNLPKYFHFFNNVNFLHVVDINPSWTDQEIWDFALKNNKIILTKDTDFYNRFISSEVFPKIVFFQLGNQTLSQLHLYFQENWDTIQNALLNASMVIAKKEEITVIQ